MVAFPNLAAEMTRYQVQQKDLSTATNKSRPTISNWLCGKSEISNADCKAIRDKLFPSLSIDYLFDSQPLSR